MPQINPVYELPLVQPSRPLMLMTRKLLIIFKIVLIAALLLARVPNYWLFTLILAAVTVLEWLALKIRPAVRFSDSGILFTGVLPKTYGWDAVSNVILRDGLLTIDFRSNRLFQKEVDAQAGEADFNAWCMGKLSGLKK